MRRRFRRRATRRNRKPARTYTIAYLLSKQPKTLAKQPEYPLLMTHYHASDRLKSLRFSRRCYTLLHHARVAPHNLHHFYRTYHLPADPFFPLFFAAKRAYLAEREHIKEERRRYILERMRSLPPDVLATVRYLGHLERHYNAAGRSPLWQSDLFPSSKKAANQLAARTTSEWAEVVGHHLATLQRRYRRLPSSVAERVLACHVLGLIPDPGRGSSSVSRTLPVPPRVSREQVVRRYRTLSLLHHPDHGGDHARFIEIKRARDVLLDHTRDHTPHTPDRKARTRR